jgi:hypothetical protein
MIPEKLKSPKTWIGALIAGCLAAAVFLFAELGVEAPEVLTDELEARTGLVEGSADGSGDAEPEEGSADGSGDAEPEEGSADGSGDDPEGSAEGSGE